MVRTCFVRNCRNRSDRQTHLTFHKFPTRRPDVLQAWIQAVGRVPSLLSSVCSAHFLPQDFTTSTIHRRTLQPYAVPSVFSPGHKDLPVKKPKPSPRERTPSNKPKPKPKKKVAPWKTLVYPKGCLVPSCPNTTSNSTKFFFGVPKLSAELRAQWMKAIGREDLTEHVSMSFWCCEDHFDLETDMKNYDHMVRTNHNDIKPSILRGVVPHRNIDLRKKEEGRQKKAVVRYCVKPSPKAGESKSYSKKDNDSLEQRLTDETAASASSHKFTSAVPHLLKPATSKPKKVQPTPATSSATQSSPIQPQPATTQITQIKQEMDTPEIRTESPQIPEQSSNSLFDSNIVIKQEIIETEQEPVPTCMEIPWDPFQILPAACSSQMLTNEPLVEYVRPTAQQEPLQSNGSSSGARARDDFDLYGEFVASKLRKLDRLACLYVQNKINKLLICAETDKLYDPCDNQ